MDEGKEPYLFYSWAFSDDFISFDEKSFPSGIVQFVLLDTEMNPLSERLIFCLPEGQYPVFPGQRAQSLGVARAVFQDGSYGDLSPGLSGKDALFRR